ncbi:HNH endonuclease [Labrys monachus]|jgi:5-methylcytosine-specific restriction endonuclease McrA|uniref:5-methylcytosine-specific restriction endonuclease McrA n=1 Tax=Labrys monachus TaxID=217067 RepID=A0ABU0F819_9HYPH|nr:HNH endonuclease [Labrys monachus]MDQ0390586.1 5-methylcytosine-specific restriction endonuclease McrA [Labrys monachus]
MSSHPALILNADFRPLRYFPLSLLSWQDALRAVFLDRVSVVAEYDAFARSPSTKVRLPSVVALRDYQKVDRTVPFTRFNLFLRDAFTCQYCGQGFAARDLQFEHVIPRSRGGATSWENIVAACGPCNALKADRLDMRPFRKPARPSPWNLLETSRRYPHNYLHESWVDYLYWDSELVG